jgi:hypothetical protein
MTRDEFQQMLDQHGIVFVGDAAWRVAQLVAAAEREACAKAAESEPAGMMNCDANGSPSDEYVAKWKVAAAIRARGEK